MKYLVLFILLAVMSPAHAGYIDLRGGDVERQALCMQGKKKMLCVAVRKDGKLYQIKLDEKGEYSIHYISPKGDILLWTRGAV